MRGGGRDTWGAKVTRSPPPPTPWFWPEPRLCYTPYIIKRKWKYGKTHESLPGNYTVWNQNTNSNTIFLMFNITNILWNKPVLEYLRYLRIIYFLQKQHKRLRNKMILSNPSWSLIVLLVVTWRSSCFMPDGERQWRRVIESRDATLVSLMRRLTRLQVRHVWCIALRRLCRQNWLITRQI